jgi:FkbM family methyltransferase
MSIKRGNRAEKASREVMVPCMSKFFKYLNSYIKAFGFRQGLAAFSATYLHRRPVFPVPLGTRNVWLRDDPSDRFVFRQIFIDRDYDTRGWRQDTWLRTRYEAILAAGRVPMIIDAGANIGLSSVWFSEEFPQARIYAVEPNGENFSLLIRNAIGRQITPLAGAVWDDVAQLRIANPDAASDAFRVVEGEGDLRAYSVIEICRMERRGDLFIVKVDIEGGESGLFRSNTDWMADPALMIGFSLVRE